MSLRPALRIVARQVPTYRTLAIRSFATTPRTLNANDDKRQTLGQAILNLATLSATQLKDALKNQSGDIGEILTLSNKEQLKELTPILAAWAKTGGTVDATTAAKIVEKCYRAGQKDVAKQFTSKAKDYGFPPVNTDALARLEAMEDAKYTSASFESLFT